MSPALSRTARCGPALAVAAVLALAGCGGSGGTATSASSSPAPASSAPSPAPPAAAPAPATSAPSSSATSDNSAQGTKSNAAVCRQLEADARSLQQGGPATTPDELAQRLNSLAGKWEKTAEQAKDPKLKSAVEKATSAFSDLADSSGGGKKVSLADLQTKLKEADAALRKACPKQAASA